MSDGIAYYGSLRRFFENEWYPSASSVGVSYWEFWDTNPRILAVRDLAYEREVIRRDREMWQQGAYIFDAFGVVMSNAFRKKGSTVEKYPDKPRLQDFADTIDDPERNERLAAIEMEQYAKLLKNRGTT